MKITLSTQQARDLLLEDEYASWTYEGAILLVEHLEVLEECTGEEIEFDVTALRCQYRETKNPTEEEKPFIVTDNGHTFIIDNF